MKPWKAYLLRCLICGPIIAGVLAVMYREKPPLLSDNVHAAYISASIIFTLCACVGWYLRIRPTRVREIVSAGLIAGMIAGGLVTISDWQASEGFLYLQYFYDYDYMFTFACTTIITTGILAALGCFIPDTDEID